MPTSSSPKGAVSATVVNGWVTLNGEVRRHYQRKAAEHAVGRVAGVLGVSDLITLSDEPIPADVADRINRAFDRNAIIDGSLIEVSNVGHTVYLDDTTTTWRAMNEAVDTAWSAPGVTDVVNRLVIIPSRLATNPTPNRPGPSRAPWTSTPRGSSGVEPSGLEMDRDPRTRWRD